MKSLIFILILIMSFSTQATVQVAFLEFYDDNGQLIALEPGGRFGHIAISYKGGWLHAFPPRPVEWVSHLDEFGKVASIIEVNHHANYKARIISGELGKLTNVYSEWEDEQTTYCSKLVGKILGIPPQPSHWLGEAWKKQTSTEKLPQKGLSPDDIFEHLMINKNRDVINYVSENSCSRSLN